MPTKEPKVYKRAPKDPRGKLIVDARIELYNGEVVLCYNDPLHVYWIEETGDYVISTTAVTKLIDKSDALIGWALNCAIKFLEQEWKVGRSYGRSQINAILAKARNARNEVSKEATDIGSAAHAWCEAYALAAINGDEHMPELPEMDGARLACEAFMDWVTEHHVTFLAAEKKVYSRQYAYSGTFDLLAIIDGKLSLVDFKTSKAVYPEYFLQLAGYAYAYHEELAASCGENETFSRIEQGMVLHLPKDGRPFDAVPTEDLDGLFSVFRALLHVLDWQKGRRKFRKEAIEARIAKNSREDLTPADQQ